ncbi:hypothetical protein, partial [Burkholderia vietnamiensis]|uniref:hypothetical protein n=1 Tax=Burkholderia vietnamiensis TaxID=60552 RepID=UPI001E395FFA
QVREPRIGRIDADRVLKPCVVNEHETSVEEREHTCDAAASTTRTRSGWGARIVAGRRSGAGRAQKPYR